MDGPFTYSPFSAAMRENFPKEVEDATILRDMGTNVFYNGNVRLTESTIYADEHLFSTLGLKLLIGKAEELTRPDVLFISRSLAEKMGGIEKVEGLTIIPDENPGLEVTIGGVFEDLPQNASLRYDMLVAMSGMDPESLNNWLGNDRYAGYVRLSPGVTPDSLTPAIHDMTLRHHDQEALRKSGYELTYTLRPLLDLHSKAGEVKNLSLIHI